MKNYQITFEWPNGDWTWIDVEANDFHQAMLIALDKCSHLCRVQRIEFMKPKAVDAAQDENAADVLIEGPPTALQTLLANARAATAAFVEAFASGPDIQAARDAKAALDALDRIGS